MTGTHHPLLVLQTLAGLPEPSDLRWNRPDAMLEWRGRTAAKRFGWSTWTSSRHAPPVGALSAACARILWAELLRINGQTGRRSFYPTRACCGAGIAKVRVITARRPADPGPPAVRWTTTAVFQISSYAGDRLFFSWRQNSSSARGSGQADVLRGSAVTTHPWPSCRDQP